LESNAREKYSEENKKNDFILKDWTEIRDIHKMGLSRYVKEKINLNDIDTQRK